MALQSSFCPHRKFKIRKRLVKNLHNKIFFDEIVSRIELLNQNSERKWGKMTVSQMLYHCTLILKVAIGEIELEKINFLYKTIGIATKNELKIFGNGIPHNMPTFTKLIVNFECNFEVEKKLLLETLFSYFEVYENKKLPKNHVLFGEMTEKDWGILEYRHLNHHLKQFNI